MLLIVIAALMSSPVVCHQEHSESLEENVKSENFMNMLKEMKPWGDQDSIILKVRALTGKEEYEGTLRFIYKETI